MDIVTIEQKLSDSKYSSLKEFVDDFNLIFDNCYEYNGSDSGECLCVFMYVCVCVTVDCTMYNPCFFFLSFLRVC